MGEGKENVWVLAGTKALWGERGDVRIFNDWRFLSWFVLLVAASESPGEEPRLAKAAPEAKVSGVPGGWERLMDARSLSGWKRTEFGGGGDVRVEDGALVVDQGEELSGLTCTQPVPKENYELEWQAQRRTGLDFFCGLTFPVGAHFLTFVVGGWGGAVVGISSINRQDAFQNETTSTRYFQDNRWYKMRLRVEPARIQAWIDEERVLDLDTLGKELDLRPGEIDLSAPLGLSTFRTGAAFRELRLRRLGAG